MFKKKDVEVVKDEPIQKIGVIIQFTQSVIYVYISRKSIIKGNTASISMKDMEGNYMEISGTFINLELNSVNEIDKNLDKFDIYVLGLPVVVIEVSER